MIYKPYVQALYGMSTQQPTIQSGRYKKFLLIGADKMSSIVDYRTDLLVSSWWDGAGAVLFHYEGFGFTRWIFKKWWWVVIF
jgi:3-oxoacyl-[acyl-carrier-protein] synthase-3